MKKSIARALTYITILTPAFTLAQGEVFMPPSRRGGGGGTTVITNPLQGIADDIPSLIAYILKTLQWLAGAVAVLVIIYGAYKILFAAGDPAKFKEGRQVIVYAIIGFAIILLGNVIADVIRQIAGGR